MSGSARLRDSPRSGLIAAALCVLATAAVLITAPAVHSALRSGASGRQPLAPRLAALSDQELAQLLPKQSEFPASWVRLTHGSSSPLDVPCSQCYETADRAPQPAGRACLAT
ncbi:hypothetical protein IQ43_07620 [Mycobacterium tuberculosis]|nr:hypothetical protein IQ43_07620 [Mycobacterium tuberculosis]AIH28537.1 hypothetical protein T209_07715 [Mycobacterium tuberculosis]AIH54986.1 hypothetical protein IQ41_07600 [Mycobacterium tuberculosis]AIH70667.1 hypothetical protein IU18_07710 [Mycobacterium tuberculosis]